MRALAIALAMLVAAPAFAQPPGQTPPVGQQQQQQQNRRERIKKRIRALRAYTLTEELQLDEATAGKLFPVLARYDDEFDRLLQERAELAKRLAQVSRGGDARASDKAIEDAVANQRAFWSLEEKRLAELRKILSSQQVARLLVVLPPLERKIENQLRNAIQGKQPQPGRRAKAGAEADEDDESP